VSVKAYEMWLIRTTGLGKAKAIEEARWKTPIETLALNATWGRGLRWTLANEGTARCKMITGNPYDLAKHGFDRARPQKTEVITDFREVLP
jgi:hypothetical protein